MTQKEKIKELIDIAALLTKRCAKIEKDALQKILKLEKRIAKLEADKMGNW